MASDQDFDYVEVNGRENPYSGNIEYTVAPRKYGENLQYILLIVVIGIVVGLLMQCGLIPTKDKHTHSDDNFLYNLSDDESYFILSSLNNSISGDIIIPSEVYGKPIKVIGNKVFKDCDKMKSVTIPDSVIYIGSNAFQGCDSLRSVTIGNGVQSIGPLAFENCDMLTSVSIGNGLTKIFGSAFANCSYLTSITIPSSVTSILSDVFAGSYRLKSIGFNGTIEQWNAIEKNSDWDSDTDSYTIYCTDGQIDKDGTITYN